MMCKNKIDSLSKEELYSYYSERIEYYGNLKNQLKYFKIKLLLHPLMLLIGKILSPKIVLLNKVPKIDTKSPVIFTSNHTNAHDFPVLVWTLKKHCFVLTDYTMINDFLVHLSTKLNGCVYVDRKSKKSSTNSFVQCVEGIKDGNSMVIFSESTWNLTKSFPMLPRYWGDIKLAKETGAPIIPVILEYVDKTCYVNIGNPFYVDGNDDLKEKDSQLYNIMSDMRRETRKSLNLDMIMDDKTYSDWLIANLNSYKNFDVEYEFSCIRNTNDPILQNEISHIINVDKAIHDKDKIINKLKYAKINYRAMK